MEDFKFENKGSVRVRLSFTYLVNSPNLGHHETMMILVMMMIKAVLMMTMLWMVEMLINIVFSEEFMAARAAFAEELRPKTIVIKDRTLRNNYASAYAVRISISCVFSLLLLLLMRLPQSLHVL